MSSVSTDWPASATAPAENMLDTPGAGPAVIRGGVLRVAGFAIGLAVGVGSFALLARHLGVDDTGRYALVLALVTFVAGLSDLGLTTIGVRELSTRAGQARDRLARNLLGLRMVVGVLGGIGIVAFAAAVGYGTTVVLGVALGAVGLFLQSWQSTLMIGLISELRIAWVAAFDLMRIVVNGALIVALVLAGAGLLPFFATTIPAAALVLAVNAFVVRGRMPLTPAFHPHEWRELIRIVVPYSAAVAAAVLYFQIAIVIVSLVGSAHDVGYFGLSSRTIQVLLILPSLSIGTAFPIFARAARDDRERLAYALGRVFEVSLAAGVLISLGLAIGAPLAIAVVGGSQFRPASAILAIQGLALGASFCGSLWAYGLLSLGRYGTILKINLTGLALCGSLVAALVALDGARGAAIGTAVGEVVFALINCAALVRADSRLMPPLKVVPAVAAGALLAGCTTLLALPVLLSVIVAVAVYAATLLLLGAIPAELGSLLRMSRVRLARD